MTSDTIKEKLDRELWAKLSPIEQYIFKKFAGSITSENRVHTTVNQLQEAMQEYSSIQVNEAKKEHLAHLKEIEEAVQKAYAETGSRVAAILIENKNLKEKIESLWFGYLILLVLSSFVWINEIK